jgi:hypothetical protein
LGLIEEIKKLNKIESKRKKSDLPSSLYSIKTKLNYFNIRHYINEFPVFVFDNNFEEIFETSHFPNSIDINNKGSQLKSSKNPSDFSSDSFNMYRKLVQFFENKYVQKCIGYLILSKVIDFLLKKKILNSETSNTGCLKEFIVCIFFSIINFLIFLW